MLKILFFLNILFLLFFSNCYLPIQKKTKTSEEMIFLNEVFYDFAKYCVCEESWNTPIYFNSSFIHFEDNIANEIKNNTEFYLMEIGDTSFRESLSRLINPIIPPKKIDIDQITYRGTYRLFEDRMFKNQGILLSLSNPSFNLIKTRACIFFNNYSYSNFREYGLAFFKKIDGKWNYFRKWIISN